MSGFYELILGGARSGKSRLAEKRALSTGKQCYYLATATADDKEMAARIREHQSRRDDQWTLIEEPLQLSKTLLEYQHESRCILVDCLTLWLSHCLHQDCWQKESKALLEALKTLRGQIIFVSNEVGSGIIPMGQLSRQFVDQSGFFHQALAEHCHRVTLSVAGLPLQLKPGNTGTDQ